MAAFSDLPAILDKRRAELAALTNKVARVAATAASDVMTGDTPVDTGQARSNWVASLDVPFEGVLPPYHPLQKLGNSALTSGRKGETENLASARAQNQAAFAGFDVEKNSSIYLRNNAEHIGLLNAGSSPQSDGNFLVKGIDAAIKALVGVWRLAP